MYLKKGKFMFSFDLKSGYHHIDIHPEQTQYLGFSWKFGNIIRYFKFLVLPFGLSSAPYIFTKIMRVMVKKCRSEGKEIILYLDDGLGIGNSLSEANVHAKAIHKDLIEAGFILNDEKSKWQPRQTCQWLGFLLDTKEGVIAPVNSKINRIKEETTKAIDSQRMHVKAVASIVGQIISMTPALGNITRLMTRSMLADVQASPSWNKLITISKESKRELEFWSECISRLKPVKMKNDFVYQRVIYSDASEVGAGGYIVDVNGASAQGSWDECQKIKSSTWRELKAVQIVLKSFISLLSGTGVKWFSDSQNVVRIIEVGSSNTELQEIAYSIYSICVENGISLRMEWVPRSLNDKADSLSRIAQN